MSQNKVLLNQLFLTPEELLLPRSLREYRILSSLNFQFDKNLSQLSNKQNLSVLQQNWQNKNTHVSGFSILSKDLLDKYAQLYSHQMIKRYLWPSYRAEDLACMNRCLINTANQARFSSLRIRFYPNLIT
jgi:hypothetical protein